MAAKEREVRLFCGQVWHRVESIFRKEDQAPFGAPSIWRTARSRDPSRAFPEVKLLAKVHEARL